MAADILTGILEGILSKYLLTGTGFFWRSDAAHGPLRRDETVGMGCRGLMRSSCRADFNQE